MKAFDIKLAKIMEDKNNWPIYASFEEDMTLRSGFWNMWYQNKKGYSME